MRNSRCRDIIFTELRGSIQFRNYSNDDLNYRLFKNPSGNRLTYDGLTILQKLYTSYEFVLSNNERFTARHLITLSRECKYPYYISATRLVLFNGEDACVIKIYGGKILPWLNNLHSTE